jgi:hypothetical protein
MLDCQEPADNREEEYRLREYQAGGTILFLPKTGTACPDGPEIPVTYSVFLPGRFIIKAHYLPELKLGCQKGPMTDNHRKKPMVK